MNLAAEIVGEHLSSRPRSADLGTVQAIEGELRQRRITELESLIAQSNTKLMYRSLPSPHSQKLTLALSVMDDVISAIKKASDEDLQGVLEKMQAEVDLQTENSEDTDASDGDSFRSSSLNASTVSLATVSSDSEDTEASSDETEASTVPTLTKRPAR